MDDGADKLDISNCGKMILLSTEIHATSDIVPLYYTRQIANQFNYLLNFSAYIHHIIVIRET